MEFLCKPHGAQIEFFSTGDQQIIGLCKVCVLTAKSPIILADDLFKDFDSKKNHLILITKIENNTNIENLNKLRDLLLNFKEIKLKQIDKLLVMINQIQQIIQNNTEQLENKILTSNLFNQLELIQCMNNFSGKSTLNQYKSGIVDLIDNLMKTDFNSDCHEILSKFPYDNLVDLNEDNSQINKQFKKLTCVKHDQEIIGIDLNDINCLQKLYCLRCMNNKSLSLTSLNDAYSTITQYKTINIQYCERFKQILNDNYQKIQICLEERITKINDKYLIFKQKFEQLKNQKLKMTQSKKQAVNDLSLNLTSNQDIRLLSMIKQYMNNDLEKIEATLKLLKDWNSQNQQFKIKSLKQLFTLINGFFIFLQQSNIEQKMISNFEYKLFQDLTHRQEEYCYAIATNLKTNTLIAGFDKSIKVFEFDNGKFEELQTLQGHSEKVQCLNFMTKKNQFISGSADSNIKVWSQDYSKKWIELYNLQGHTKSILCLQINKNEDLIISGSWDTSIKFWNQKNQNWVDSQSLTIHQERVYSLSLNKSESKLISCGYDYLILIMNQDGNKNWMVIQKIKSNIVGRRVCFITDEQFAFQPSLSEFLLIYEFDNQKNKFIKTKDIQVKKNQNNNEDCLFPQKFINSKQLLVSKNGHIIDIIQKLQNGEFETKQSIEFSCQNIYGTITEDGEYLITWDEHLKEIQMRPYQVI